ncbi:50S ribosomal protein 5, chloroplastic-like [Senna tora]|uniref:50S ribosomal protein 5, chloroplastic-like n=1 Tax=Senna tora TaxID=362788 RepID=A0A834WFN7_9FABA|nr:50S ribosomal protein 5, chloroplastic-like [Senna tora]
MALLSVNSFTPLSSSLSLSSSSVMAVATSTGLFSEKTCIWLSVPRLHVKPIDMPSKCWSGVRIPSFFPVKRTAALIVRAASDADGVASADDGGGEKEVVPVDKLPLESKLKEREEQKLRMKMAKKIRLRRKRLVRKRRLRKKGKWPPSKMNKLKNV